MSGVKSQLIFDTTDADTLEASDNVGAYIRASDGTRITHETIGSNEHLHVSSALHDGDGDAIDSTGGALHVSIQGGGPTSDHAEDAAHTTGDTGNFALAIRVDDLTAVPAGALAGTELDYQGLISGPNGELLIGANQLDIDDLNATDDAVQSWLYSGAGVAITETGGALDVNIASGAIALASEYDEDSAHTTADKGQFVFSVRVDDLTSVPASVLAGTEGDYQAFITGPNGELLIGANDLDIRDLTAASDSIASWLNDGSGNAIGSTGGSLDVNVTNSIDLDDDLADTAIENTQKTVTTTSGALLGSQLANRKWLYVQNWGFKLAAVGKSGVTAADGLMIAPKNMYEFRCGPAVSMHAVSKAGTNDFRIMELS